MSSPLPPHGRGTEKAPLLTAREGGPSFCFRLCRAAPGTHVDGFPDAGTSPKKEGASAVWGDALSENPDDEPFSR